jgi:hypothetical protein
VLCINLGLGRQSYVYRLYLNSNPNTPQNFQLHWEVIRGRKGLYKKKAHKMEVRFYKTESIESNQGDNDF